MRIISKLFSRGKESPQAETKPVILSRHNHPALNEGRQKLQELTRKKNEAEAGVRKMTSIKQEQEKSISEMRRLIDLGEQTESSLKPLQAALKKTKEAILQAEQVITEASDRLGIFQQEFDELSQRIFTEVESNQICEMQSAWGNAIVAVQQVEKVFAELEKIKEEIARDHNTTVLVQSIDTPAGVIMIAPFQANHNTIELRTFIKRFLYNYEHAFKAELGKYGVGVSPAHSQTPEEILKECGLTMPSKQEPSKLLTAKELAMVQEVERALGLA